MSNGFDLSQERHSVCPDLTIETEQDIFYLLLIENAPKHAHHLQGSYRLICVKFKDFSRLSKRLLWFSRTTML